MGRRRAADRVRRLGGGTSAFFTAQLITSATNFVVTVTMARSLAPDAFGAAALGLSLAFFFVSLQRTIVGDNLLVFVRTRSGIVPQALAVVLLATVTAAFVGLFAAVALPRFAPWYIAVAFPVMMLQDGLRYVAVARGHVGPVVLSDSMWFLATVVSFVLSLRSAGIDTVMTIWLIGGAVAVVVLLPFVALETRSAAPNRAVAFGRSTADVSGWMTVQYLVGNGAMQVAYVGMAAIAGTAAYGGYRVAQLMLAPFLTVILGSISPFVAWVGKHPYVRWSIRRFTAATSTYVAVALLPSLVVIRWGPVIIERVSGAGYVPYAYLLVPVSASIACVAAAVPPGVLLRGHGRGRALLVSGLVGTVPGALLVPLAAAVSGIAAAAWTITVVYLVTWAASVVFVRPLLMRPTADLH